MKKIKYDSIKKICPLCNSKKIKNIYNIAYNQYSFSIYGCNICNFIFMNPCFNEKTINNFYKKNYYTGNINYEYIDERKQLKYNNYVWTARLKKIKKYIKEGNLLDIGASFGGFLQIARQYYTCFGIEISKYAGNYAKKYFKNNLHIGTINDHPFPSQSFSVITMIELIEHIQDPVSALKKCFKLLKKEGLLLIQTANMDGWQAIKSAQSYHYFLPGHLSYFNSKNLSMLLKQIGFKRIKVFIPVDFGLLPKLLKSRGQFNKITDYIKWFKIIWYHYKSMLKYKGRPLTSSMVIYAFK